MTKRSAVMMLLVAVALFAPAVVSAHECGYDENHPEECRDTPVQPNWRDGNYIPLFDINDRDDDSQHGGRYNAQRWRDECNRWDSNGNYSGDQQCAWVRGGTSFLPGQQSVPAPNELHVGYAANHCFLFEAAHQCEDHDASNGEGVHDAHGGAAYVDICVTPNAESKYCDDGAEDTQAGVTVMDHNGCGTIVPVVACTDEYHLVRPLDADYTLQQQENSIEYIGRILADPELYLCGYQNRRGGGNPICPRTGRGPIGTISDSLPNISVADVTEPMVVAKVVGGRVVAAGIVIPASEPASSTGGARGAAAGAGWVLALAVGAFGLRARRVFAAVRA